MARYGLGIDTGGTFTDAVIMDLDSGELISKAKSPTTHSDLSVGLYRSMDMVFSGCSVLPSEISLAGVSTTLATNSVLEGKGGDVGLILIGWDPMCPVSFGERNQVFVKGGYDFKGNVVHSLDTDELKDAIMKVSEGVDAIAISGLFAILNPYQERTVKQMCIDLTGLPTVCGTELSSILGIDERARTAVLNGRLVSVIKEFFDGLEDTFRRKGIQAPIMVYKGDGSVMSIARARKYPVESVFSGPAASSVGGRILSGYDDFIMVDIGGTSTDVALMDKGMPEIRSDGANICGWKTHVKAVDMYTIALGGDSLIKLNDAKTLDLGNGVVIPFFSVSRYKSFNFNIGPERVIPLSVFSADNPAIKGKMRSTGITDYYLLTDLPKEGQVSQRCMIVANAMAGKGPMSILEIRDDSPGLWDVDDEVRALQDGGFAVHAGLTPSDLMVYRGEFVNGDPEGSKAGIEALSALLRMRPDRFVDRLMDMIHSKIAEAILTRLLDEKMDRWRSPESYRFINELISKKSQHGFALMPRIDVPIVGIGAPTRFIMGDVGERLGAETVFPENGDVGNAVGAVCSKMVESLTATIMPSQDGMLRTIVPYSESTFHMRLEQAVEAAQRRLGELLTERLSADGAENIEVIFKFKIYSTAEDGAWTQDDLDHAEVIARAVGDPPLMRP